MAEVVRQLALFLQQALQGGAQAFGGQNPRQQLLADRGLADEVVDAAAEGGAEDVLGVAAGE
ncbi:hypothetical protein D3C78_1735300 [compost metagenome]